MMNYYKWKKPNAETPRPLARPPLFERGIEGGGLAKATFLQ
jgi:hypothetical protein